MYLSKPYAKRGAQYAAQTHNFKIKTPGETMSQMPNNLRHPGTSAYVYLLIKIIRNY